MASTGMVNAGNEADSSVSPRPAPAADALLSDLAARARLAVVEVRRSVHALRPPALDELGLVPALRETAAQYAQAGAGDGRRALVDARAG